VRDVHLKPCRLSGWAGSKYANCLVAAIESEKSAKDVLEYAQQKGLSVCCRGGRYSHADAILNDNGIVLDVRNFNRILSWDAAAGILIHSLPKKR